MSSNEGGGISSPPGGAPETFAERASLPPPPPSLLARGLAVLIPIVILLGGIGFAALMVATRPEADRTEPGARGVPVVTTELRPSTEPLVVRAHGQVVPARQVVVSPELTGRVIAMNPELVPGGHVAEGDTLIRIDARDYRNALQQQSAQVESSQLSLTQEQSRRVIAEREWALLGRARGGSSESGRELALREPHTRAAQASVEAARAGMRSARTNLSRTTLRAPFDAFVQMENVEIGQLVGPASQIATLVGTEHLWVRVTVPIDQLAWIQIPSEASPTGSRARVVQNVGESSRIVRDGRVIRLLGDLDPVGRMARILVEIDDPLGLRHEANERGDASALPMLVGAFVDVEIEAGEVNDVYEIPRTALHADNRVYLFGEAALEIREIDVIWRRPDTVLARGLEPGEELITSSLATPIAGTVLRRAEPETPAEVEPSEPTAEAR